MLEAYKYITTDMDIQQIEIINSLGQKIYDEPFKPEPLDLSLIEIGAYIVKLVSTEGPNFYKISVIR